MSCAGLAAMAETACEPLRRRPPGNPGSRSACWPAAPWPGSCATCTAGPTRARCAITRCCGRCCASSAMAERLARCCAMRWGRHAPPDRLLQHPASRGACRPPDPESGPSVADIGYSELDLPAVMGVNGSIALRQPSRTCVSPITRCWTPASCRAATWSPTCWRKTLLLFVTPEVLRGIAQLFFSGRHSLPHRGLRKCTSARTCRARSRNNGGDAARRPDLVLFDAHAPIHPLGFSLDPARGALRRRHGGPIAPCNCWSGWDSARSICMVRTCAEHVSRRFYESADARLPSALDRQFDSHMPAFRDASRLLGARGLSTTCRPAAPWTRRVSPKRHWTTLKRHALPS